MTCEDGGPRTAGPVLVSRLFISIDTLFAQLRRKASLGPNERVSIECLWEFGSMPMSELADRTAVTRAAVTTLVDRLEDAGLVLRDGDLDDRRRTMVGLSDAGRELCMLSTRSWFESVGDVFGDLSPEVWAQAAPLFEALTEATRLEADHMRGSTGS